MYADQREYEVRCEWGMPGLTLLAPDVEVIVIVDVLSFSTTVDVAVGRGVTVWPYHTKASAAEFAQEIGAQVAGARQAGGYSLSPASFENAPRDLRVVLPSPNGGTLSREADKAGAVVVAGCLRNAAAVARFVGGRRVAVIPAGERWPDGSLRPAIEDLVGAGAIIAQLSGRRSPEADIAVAAFQMACVSTGGIAAVLTGCGSGRELIERNCRRDVELATAIDFSSCVPALQEGHFRS